MSRTGSLPAWKRISPEPVAGGGALLQRQHVPAAQRLRERGRVLRLSCAALSRRTRMPSPAHWRAGWLNYRLGQLRRRRAGCSTSRFAISPAHRNRLGPLLARPSLRDAGSQHGRAAANYRTIVRVYQHYLLCADGASAPGRAGQHRARLCSGTGRHQGCRCRISPTVFPRTAPISPRQGCLPTPA